MASAVSINLESAAFLQGLKESRVFLEAEAMIKQRERATRIVERAKALAPVLTGELRESIKIQGEGIDKGMPYIAVGSTDDHALFVEYGTSHSAAEPFLRPAIAEEK
jgi:HK97 gp10 family phage protein